jgi:hypothetical protein
VSLVTQDWRWRMVTPPKGDYRGIPITAAARQVADAWDPTRDEAAGEACRSYGAAALMSVPGRFRVSWLDDRTLKVESDAGMQTRLLRFAGGDSPRAKPTWQGTSTAQWLKPRANVPLVLRPADRLGVAVSSSGTGEGAMKVVTTNLRSGYLRKNGVPYSAKAILTEYWDVYRRGDGEAWLTVTTPVDDPQYLREPRLVAWPFRKERDGAKWNPTPCSARW